MSTTEPKSIEELLAEFQRSKPACNAECADCGVAFFQPALYRQPTFDAAGNALPVVDRCADCDERREREQKRRARIRRALELNIPRRFAAASLATYRCPPGSAEALAAAKAWTPGGPRGLYLWSNEKGTGKSHLAFSLARREIEAGLRVYATDTGRLFARMRATFNRRPGDPGETVDDVMHEVESCDLLILDDLGTEKPTEWVMEQLFGIVNARYLDERPVVITSNHSIGELAQRLGEMAGDRIASRLTEMTQSVHVVAADYRTRRTA